MDDITQDSSSMGDIIHKICKQIYAISCIFFVLFLWAIKCYYYILLSHIHLLILFFQDSRCFRTSKFVFIIWSTIKLPCEIDNVKPTIVICSYHKYCTKSCSLFFLIRCHIAIITFSFLPQSKPCTTKWRWVTRRCCWRARAPAAAASWSASRQPEANPYVPKHVPDANIIKHKIHVSHKKIAKIYNCNRSCVSFKEIDLTRKLSESYDMQEKLAADNADLEVKRLFRIVILSSSQGLDNVTSSIRIENQEETSNLCMPKAEFSFHKYMILPADSWSL